MDAVIKLLVIVMLMVLIVSVGQFLVDGMIGVG